MIFTGNLSALRKDPAVKIAHVLRGWLSDALSA
jgi:hypothetical protein